MFLANNRSEKIQEKIYANHISVSTRLLLQDPSRKSWSKTLHSHHVHVHKKDKYLKKVHTKLSCSGTFNDGNMTNKSYSRNGSAWHPN